MVYFQRRVERAEAEPGIEQFWQMIVTGQKIAEAASDKCSRIAVYNIVGGGNTHLFQLGLRPVRNLALQTDTAVHDERKARSSSFVTAAFPARVQSLGMNSPQRAESFRERYSYFTASTGSNRTAKSSIP